MSSADHVAALASSLVSVQSHRALSSGFVWRPSLIVTADEALADEGAVSVMLPGGEVKAATIAGRDPATDIAVLRVDAALTPAPLADPVQSAGAAALVVGARDGLPLAAVGAVAFAGPAWRSLRGGDIAARVELDLRLRRQAEGGLAVDANGLAFGMAVFGPRRRVLVIPAATIARVAPILEARGRMPHGYLGLALQPVRLDGPGENGAGRGAMVMGVDAGGPGAQAGVRQGDIVTAWNGAPLTGVGRLSRQLGADSVGQAVTLGLTRGGAAVDVRLTIGERPAA